MAKQVLYRSLYRACLREVRAWKPLPFSTLKTVAETGNDSIFIADPVISDKAGMGGFTTSKHTITERLQRWNSVRDDFLLEHTESWLKQENIDATNPQITTEQLCKLIRMEFEFASDTSLDRGFAALQIIRELLQSSFCTTISFSNNIRVEVTTKKLVLKNPTNEIVLGNNAKHRIFLYRVRMQNTAAPKVTLKGRAFTFAHVDDGGIRVVHEVPKYQPGVVGLFPELEPGGACFEYQSFVDMDTADAFMEGCYQFQISETDEKFEVYIDQTQMRDFGVKESS